MTEGDTLAKALEDVRQRRTDVQAEHERLTAELAKLRQAERSLAAIVEGTPVDDAGFASAPDGPPEARPRGGGRGPRGPRANSAKGRLKALMEGAGAQGLSQAEIARRLHDVAPATLNTYLSMMVTSGEIARNGDFFVPGNPSSPADDAAEDEAEAVETSPEDDETTAARGAAA